jgi:hypothetical protein
MTGPIADQIVAAHLAGQDPGTGAWLDYQSLPILARILFGTNDVKTPFETNWGSGNTPNSSASYDGVTGTGQQAVGRHIDPYGNVAELRKVWLLLWYWFLDGCPTNQGAIGSPGNRFTLYQELASRLRPWPQGYPGAQPGESQHSYPTPSAATPLDNFSNPSNDTID